MTRIISLLLLLIFYSWKLDSQLNPGRYLSPIFTNVNITSEVQFSSQVPQPVSPLNFCSLTLGIKANAQEYNTSNIDLFMNIYEPAGDTIKQRPLIILCFGGGFVDGSKTEQSMQLLADGFAKCGFVAAVIDYRLGMQISESYLSERAVYRGIQDSRAAVRFFRNDAVNDNIYKIDPNKIFVGGHSAGAFMALHNAYMDENERPDSTYASSQDGNLIPDLNGLDEVGGFTAYSGKANAIFSLAGALGELHFLNNAMDIPAILFHSTDDGTINYVSGVPFGPLFSLFCGANLPLVSGSSLISQRMNNLNIIHEYYEYNNRGHDVHFNGVSLYPDIIPLIDTFFHRNLLEPSIESIDGNRVVCVGGLAQQYHVNSIDGFYYEYEVEGGVLNITNSTADSISITWDNSAPQHRLTIHPFSIHGAAGKEEIIEISLINNGNNEWIGGSNQWGNVSSWSQGHLPLPCQDITINSASPITVELTKSEPIYINSLSVGENVTFIQRLGSKIVISN